MMYWLRSKCKKLFKTLFVLVILAGAVFLFTKVFRIVHIRGNSMQPGLSDGDYVLVNCLKEAERGDIVVIDSDSFENENVIKRVIGMEGDTLKIKKGKLIRSGEELEEPYREKEFTEDMKERTVGEGCIFVIGDNSAHSYDSRKVGDIPVEDVYGVVIFQFGGHRLGETVSHRIKKLREEGMP